VTSTAIHRRKSLLWRWSQFSGNLISSTLAHLMSSVRTSPCVSRRRFTRLTNAFSKKCENHWAALYLWFGYYNLCRIQRTIRVTPATEAGIIDHVWELSELRA
jgi:hypothetical protein